MGEAMGNFDHGPWSMTRGPIASPRAAPATPPSSITEVTKGSVRRGRAR
jgi:hypothetical protein